MSRRKSPSARKRPTDAGLISQLLAGARANLSSPVLIWPILHVMGCHGFAKPVSATWQTLSMHLRLERLQSLSLLWIATGAGINKAVTKTACFWPRYTLSFFAAQQGSAAIERSVIRQKLHVVLIWAIICSEAYTPDISLWQRARHVRPCILDCMSASSCMSSTANL